MSSDTRWDQYEQGFSSSQISYTSQQFLDKPDQEDCATSVGQQDQDVSQFLRILPRLPSIQSITSQQDTHFIGSLPAIQQDTHFIGSLPAIRSIPQTGIVGKNCYDCSKVEATYLALKSRLACVAFAPDKHAITDQESKVVVLKNLMALLDKMHRRCRGSFGLVLRYGSFFTLGEQTWFVFVSKGAQYFHKWHQVFLGLEAANIKVYYHRGETFKNSMNSVTEMFPSVSIEELLTNQHRVAIDDLVSETADMQLSSSSHDGKKKKKRSRGDETSSSPSPVKKGKGQGKQTAAKASKMLSSSPEKRTPLRPLQNQQADAETSDGPSCIQSLDFNVDKLFDPPSAESVPAKVQTPLDELANCCVQFLSSASLENCAQHEAQLRRYLEVPQHRGKMGLFLLDGRLNELYVQAAYLKEFVFRILKERYEMEPFTLSTSDVHSCRGYNFCDMDFKQALARVTDFYDGLKSLVTFALHDRVSVLVYLSFYVLRCHRENKDRRDGKQFSIGSNFLSSEAAVLGEVCVRAPFSFSQSQ
jgi:hypothetical protein